MTLAKGTEKDIEQRDALVGQLFQAAISAMEVFSIYLGDRLGYYQALAGASLTGAELATSTGTHERYAREWLEQQSAAGILGADDPAAAPEQRRYTLPPAYHEVFLAQDSLSYMAGMLRLVVGATKPLPAVLEAFRTGGGVPYADYGADTIEGIATMNRPMFNNLLASEWLPAIPATYARLQADPPARVADIGCGTGWSSIALARAYPKVRVDGFDLDHGSIAMARANAEAAGVADRVTFHVRDASDPDFAGQYDLVTAFETLHDMAQPVEALRTMKRLANGQGTILIADERVEEVFSAPGTEIERLNYAFSVLHCLPSSMAEQPSAGTGTVMRPPTLRAYAREAGFREVEILPIENDFWRFYKLVA